MIRREIFGGLVFDEATHKIFTLDQPSFRLIELCFIHGKEASTIQSELNNQFGNDWSTEEVTDFCQTVRAKLGPALLLQRGRTDDSLWQGPWYGQHFIAPISNFWSFTNLCNLHCKHCAWNSSKPLEGELDTEQCLRLIDEMHTTGVCELSFSGGEPLVEEKRKQLLAMASYGAQLGFHLGLATNATLVTDEVADELLHAGINEVQVSFEGLEAHEVIRGRGILKKTFTGVEVLKRKGFDVTFSVTINKTNIHEVDTIFASVQRAGIRSVRFVRFVPIGRGKDRREMFQLSAEQELWLANRLWQKRWELAPEMEVTFNKHYVTIGVINSPHLGNIPDTFKWNWDCPSGRSRICVMPQGNIAPCPLIGSLGLSGGNVLETPLTELWETSPFFNYIRGDKRQHDAQCTTCSIWGKCRGGCKAVSYAHTDDLMAADPLCLQLLPSATPAEVRL